MKQMLVDFAYFQNAYPWLGAGFLFLLKSGVIVLLAAGASAFLRGHSARARNLVWRAALLGFCALLLWQIVPHQSRPEALAWRAAPSEVPNRHPVAGVGEVASEFGSLSGTLSEKPASGAAGSHLFRRMEQGLVSLWAGVALVLLLRCGVKLAGGTVWLRRNSREMAWNRDSLQGAAVLGLCRGLEIRTGPAIETPLVAGLVRPVIYLPSAAADWAFEKLRKVLRHEMAHCQRKDLWWQWGGAGLCCLLWWNPLAWLAFARMKAEAEQAADDLVVMEEGNGESYARLLVELASEAPGRLDFGISMLGGSPLEQRLKGILNPHLFRNSIGLRGSGLLGALLLLMSVCLGTGIVLGEVDLTNSKGEIIHFQADPAKNQLAQGDFKKNGTKLEAWTGSIESASSPEPGVIRLKAGEGGAIVGTVLNLKPDWKWLTVSARIRLAPGTKLDEEQQAGVSFTPVDGEGQATGPATVIADRNREGYTNWIAPIRTIRVPEGTVALKVEMRVTAGAAQLDCSAVDVVPTREEDELDHRLVDKFYDAIRAGDVKAVSLMLAEEPRLTESRRGTADNGTPLIFCAWLEQPEVAQVLIDHKANVEAIDYGAWRSTPLMWCGWWGSPKTAEVLLKAGADVKRKSGRGVTPLSSAKGGKKGNTASKATPEAYDETIALFEK